MDVNKEESERYFTLALKYIFEGDSLTALKILYKAEDTFPSQRAKDLIALLEKLRDSAKDGSSQEAKSSNENTRSSSKKSHSPSPQKKSKEEKVTVEYTQAELKAVQRIKRCRDFYEILEVEKEAGEAEIKSAYRRLAKQLHPDKNKAPGATEAFKVFSNAFEVLSDREKRRQFDNIFNYTSGNRESKDLFKDGSFQRRPPKSSSTRNTPLPKPKWYDKYLLCARLLALAAIIIYFLYPGPTIAYSLTKTFDMPYERRTQNLRIPYFVKDSSVPYSQRAEKEVEREHIDNLKRACSKEEHYKEFMLQKAKNKEDYYLEYKALKIETPSCYALHYLYVTSDR